MTEGFTGPLPVRVELDRALEALQEQTPADEIESERVDLKEEPGRRDPQGRLLPGAPQNEKAAKYLAGELACFANSGGGAIVLGVANDGSVPGTGLDVEWLRYRIYELTDRRLTVSGAALTLRGQRVLELIAPAALEPIRFQGKIRQRVGKQCVEIDAASWAEGHQVRIGYDWSAQPSARTFADVRGLALEVARDYLRASGEVVAAELASASDQDLVRRLNLCDDDGRLVNAGELLLCAGPAVIDYRRRSVAGADATARIFLADRSLLEQLSYVIEAIDLHNPRVDLEVGWVRGESHRVPGRAAREAVVNGVTHRDWQSPAPTEVEHVGDRFTVTSPGGFIGGVSSGNIITHPSVPRYPRLAQALATLRVAERQGIGVDRMHRDMLVQGLEKPVIEELPGPAVRTVLIGGEPDRAWLLLRGELEPSEAREDLDFLLVLDWAVRHGWVSGDQAAPVIQRSRAETNDVLERLRHVYPRGFTLPLLVGVDGDPLGDHDPYDAAWQPSTVVKSALVISTRYRPPRRELLLADYARKRRRISSTEAASLILLHPRGLTGRRSAGVAHTGGDAVDRGQQRPLQRRVGGAVAVLA